MSVPNRTTSTVVIRARTNSSILYFVVRIQEVSPDTNAHFNLTVLTLDVLIISPNPFRFVALLMTVYPLVHAESTN